MASRRLAALAAILVPIVTAAACSRRVDPRRYAAFLGQVRSDPQIASSPALPVAAEKVTVSSAAPGDAREDALASMAAAQKLVRNAEVSVEVDDFAAANRKADEIPRSFGGYVADAQSSGETRRRRGTLTLRVRADRFDAAVAALEALGRVRSEHVTVEDVTKAYADLDARLRVKRDAAERIRAILRDRTAKLADVLKAETELSSLVEQIETMEGERRYSDRQIAFSTIAADLAEPESAARPSAFDPLAEAVRNSLATLSRSLATLLLGGIAILPWALGLGTLLALRRRLRARRLRREAAAEA
jgi:uncharacterized protein DUF4349